MEKRIVYLDYAATTPVLPEVTALMLDILNNDFGNPSSIHHYGRKAKTIVEHARKIIAKYIKASIGEVFFTSGASESSHTIMHCCIRDLGVTRIISSNAEHHCTLHTLEYLKENTDVEVCLLEVQSDGCINYSDLEAQLESSDKKTLVSLMHGNNEIGSLHNLKKLGDICSEQKALLLIDAAQTFGKYPIDVQENKISFLTASAHKLFAPKGTGLLFMSNKNIFKPLFLGGSQERNIRAGTENVHGIAAFAKAIEIALVEMESRHQALAEIKSYCKEQLAQIPGIEFNGNPNPEESMQHVLSVSFPPSDKGDMLMFNLDIAGICASSGSACSSGVENDSHVLEAIGHDPKRKTIRFSFSHFTTKEEIDFLINSLKKIN